MFHARYPGLLSLVGMVFLLTACAGGRDDTTQLRAVPFSALSGWSQDHHAEPFRLFQQSCAVVARRATPWQTRMGDPVGDPAGWRATCHAARQLQNPTDGEARIFFERHFTPYRVTTPQASRGQITGYYEPMLHGSYRREGPYQTPVYGVPKDFRSGQRYHSRADIEAGALQGRAPVLLYVDDPIMLFFLHIQGSGKVRLPDGKLVGLQYAAQNGFPYVAIGGILKQRGELNVLSLQTIRTWLLAHPDQMQAVMNENPSYVFFQLSSGDAMAKGAIGLPLTPLRSIAVDDDRAAYGVPTYIDTTRQNYTTQRPEKLARLFVSQDTGGALHGPHRADLFFGRGEEEEWQAGHQNTQAKVFWLLPREASPLRLLPQF